MQRHFHEELEALKQRLLAMGGLVEDQIRRVMRALVERDDALAREVIERDQQVNAYDVEVDETCVGLLALHQPAAGDLRFITTAMKIVTDLERMGDQAVNIAQRVLAASPAINATRARSGQARALERFRGMGRRRRPRTSTSITFISRVRASSGRKFSQNRRKTTPPNTMVTALRESSGTQKTRR